MYNKKLKPINKKNLQAKFDKIAKEKIIMDKRNIITYEASFIKVGS